MTRDECRLKVAAPLTLISAPVTKEKASAVSRRPGVRLREGPPVQSWHLFDDDALRAVGR